MNNSDISARPLKRRSTENSALPFFTPSSETFNPQPYAPANSTGARRVVRTAEIVNHGLKPMDPMPGDGISNFIRLPFINYPNSHLYPEGLTFSWLAENPDFFLDARDFKGENDDEVPNAVVYPPSLEPPRGWCPAKKKDSRSSGDDSDEAPALRCTFCRRRYAGVNAKSMWRRHVLEKHKIPMSNRREGPIESNRSSRSNKENRGFRRPSAGSNFPRSVSCGSLPTKSSSARTQSRTLLPAFEHSPQYVSSQLQFFSQPIIDHGLLSLGDEEIFESPLIVASSQLPELVDPAIGSPPIVPSQELINPPELAHTSTKTPSKRERRIKSRLPWKFPDPKHPLYNSPDELVVGVPIEGIKGDGLQTGYVPAQSSPFNFATNNRTSPPASSSPTSAKMLTGRVLGWKRRSSDGTWTTLPGLPSPDPPSVLKYTGPLPVPVDDRFEVDNSNLSMSTDGFTSDELDTSLATLDDFPSWFDVDGISQQSPSKMFLIGSSGMSFPDTPIKHSNGQVLSELFNMSTVDQSSSWMPQPSGIGLGLLLPSYAKGSSEQATQMTSNLQMQSTENTFSANWDFGTEFVYPDDEELEGPENSPDDGDVFDVGGSCAPPMKRRKTVC